MCELTETALRDDLAIMAKYGRLVGYDVSAPTTSRESQPTARDGEPLCEDCGEWSSTLVDGLCPGCLWLRNDREARRE